MVLLGFALFGIACAALAVLFSYREEKSKKLLIKQNKELSRHAYQLEVLGSLQEKIGLSMNIFDIAEIIATTVERVIDVTTVSYAIIEQDKIHLHTFPRQPVAELYFEELERKILTSIHNIDAHTKEIKVDETRSQTLQLSTNTFASSVLPTSFITVPLILKEQFVGIIAVSSHLEKAYTEEDLTMLNRIVNQSITSLERLDSLLDIERVKTDSLIMNLSAGAILFLFEDDGINLASINKAAIEFLDLPISPTADMVIDTLNSYVSIIDLVKEALLERKEIVREDIQLKQKHFKLFIRPVNYAVMDKIIGISITMQDITTEKELSSLREQSMNIMVHELRAPLTSIKGAAGLLQRGTLTEDEREKMIHRVSVSTERMLRDISNFLDAAKIESGRFSISLHEENLNTVILDEIDLLSSLAEEKHISITHTLDSNLGTFYFDKERISQVLTNLISNAIKFVHEGGEIQVSSKASGTGVEVVVSDNGIGIPAEKIPTLFSRYQQVNSQLQKGGTGLGLYISKQIVDAHHGRIWIESDDGRGTTIRFILPLLHHQKTQDANTDFPQEEALLN